MTDSSAAGADGTGAGAPARRRRRRGAAPQGPPAPAPGSNAEPDGASRGSRNADPPRSEERAGPRRTRRDGARGKPAGERGLREIVGTGSSAVGVEGALRARDVARPSEQNLAEAERELHIVRRNWRPPPS
jgi:hypothetical protein